MVIFSNFKGGLEGQYLKESKCENLYLAMVVKESGDVWGLDSRLSGMCLLSSSKHVSSIFTNCDY